MSNASTSELLPASWSTRYVLLVIAVVAQFISLLITWPLWNVRTEVPHLPVFSLESFQFSFGWLLLLSLAVVPFRPKVGIWLHFAIMFVACLFDQMRAQPQFLATWILMLTTLGQSWKNYARWFLGSLWIWAGLHKAISPDWLTYRAFNMASAVGLDAASWFFTVAIVVAATELVVGLLAWFKPKWGAIGCVMLHVGIAIYLSPLFRDWNYSVLPWNLATAIIGAWILWTCDAKPTKFHRAAFAVFMILPMGFFVGWLDHGYSHVLYSGGIPKGLITRTDGSVEQILGWGELAIPFPNERRTLKQRFEADSQEGDRLHIFDPRAALDDLHFIKRAKGVERIERSKFFEADSNSVVGMELDCVRHIFLLSLGGAQMRKKSESAMMHGIEFLPEHFESRHMSYVPFLPNVEEIQLAGTSVTDEDLVYLVNMPKLEAVGLNQTAITDRGIEILSRSRTLEVILVEDTQVSEAAIEKFLNSR